MNPKIMIYPNENENILNMLKDTSVNPILDLKND